jgi:dolichyl-phosphate beta-glucosyltransferase
MNQELSIVIPVYNEEKRIGKTLIELKKFIVDKRIKPEIIIVDDGSSDHTEMLLQRFKEDIKIISLKPNRGKGYAIKVGMMAAKSENILFMDADLATPLFEIERFLTIFKEKDILIGSRTSKQTKRTRFRALAGFVFKLVCDLVISLPFKDTQCGFKLFKKAAAKDLFSRAKINRWGFDIEILYLAIKSNYKIKELPVAWEDKAGSTVRMFRDTYLMIRDLIKIRLSHPSGEYSFKQSLSNGRMQDGFPAKTEAERS